MPHENISAFTIDMVTVQQDGFSRKGIQPGQPLRAGAKEQLAAAIFCHGIGKAQPGEKIEERLPAEVWRHPKTADFSCHKVWFKLRIHLRALGLLSKHLYGAGAGMLSKHKPSSHFTLAIYGEHLVVGIGEVVHRYGKAGTGFISLTVDGEVFLVFNPF